MNNETNDIHEELAYFSPVLPWQSDAWNQLVTRYERLPHGLLFAGMKGIGKRLFAWRFVAWILCDNKDSNREGACGHCQSCSWLIAGTHPDLKVLPESCIPTILNQQRTDNKSKSSSSNSNKKTKSKKSSQNKENVKTNIKVDDIRELQPFINQGSSGNRICVIDNADQLTVAAANALLKTLEEPREGVFILLISDMPAKLLPTIKSRVQQVAINNINRDVVNEYVVRVAESKRLIDSQDKSQILEQVNQSINLANGAPLSALEILKSDWYKYRTTWLNTWLALRVGKRSSIAASDYWQKTLPLTEFMALSEVMLMDISREVLGIKPLQQDIELRNYETIKSLKVDNVQSVVECINDTKISCQQNVQDKMAYDKLLSAIAGL